MKYAFVFCGPIGSGKSSVSKLFAKEMGGGWNGFGKTVKEIAVERGLAVDREGLQTLGAKLVNDERHSFCRQVVAGATENGGSVVVIDGLRHVAVLREIQSIMAEDKVYCIYVDAPKAERLRRVQKRDGLSDTQLATLESHSTEIEVETNLKKMSDLVVTNADSAQKCSEIAVQWAKTLLNY